MPTSGDDKQAMLETISRYLSKAPMERLKFCLERRRAVLLQHIRWFPSGSPGTLEIEPMMPSRLRPQMLH